MPILVHSFYTLQTILSPLILPMSSLNFVRKTLVPHEFLQLSAGIPTDEFHVWDRKIINFQLDKSNPPNSKTNCLKTKLPLEIGSPNFSWFPIFPIGMWMVINLKYRYRYNFQCLPDFSLDLGKHLWRGQWNDSIQSCYLDVPGS